MFLRGKNSAGLELQARRSPVLSLPETSLSEVFLAPLTVRWTAEVDSVCHLPDKHKTLTDGQAVRNTFCLRLQDGSLISLSGVSDEIMTTEMLLHTGDKVFDNNSKLPCELCQNRDQMEVM